MSRSGYSEDWEGNGDAPPDFYRQAVDNALAGRRGQKFLREMLAAMDALPAPRLIADEIVAHGEACAIGSVALLRGLDVAGLDPEDAHRVAKLFGIAECMAREIVYENDESHILETPEQRFTRMRAWIVKNIRAEQPT